MEQVEQMDVMAVQHTTTGLQSKRLCRCPVRRPRRHRDLIIVPRIPMIGQTLKRMIAEASHLQNLRPCLQGLPVWCFHVKIVVPLLPRCGEEMKVDGQSAMPVVSQQLLSKKSSLTIAGLYHKLHGVHRPVAMKKSVIKRRKRVVPATSETDAAALQQNSFTVSPSPQPSHLEAPGDVRQRASSVIEVSLHDVREGHHLAERRGTVHGDLRTHSYGHSPHLLPADAIQPSEQIRSTARSSTGTLGVDFTGYQIGASSGKLSPHSAKTHIRHSQHLPPLSSFDHEPWSKSSDADSNDRLSPLNPTRKRSRSATEQSSPSTAAGSSEEVGRPRLSSIVQILNNPQKTSAVEDVPVDPHLSALPLHLQQHRQSIPSNHQSQQIASAAIAHGQMTRADTTHSDSPSSSQSDKMARLKHEAEQMRELLRSKEREIQEMERGS